jgi:hypothetical protein
VAGDYGSRHSSRRTRAQQGAEKALKGFLVFSGVVYPLTHDLRKLLHQCEEIDAKLTAILRPAVGLTQLPFAFGTLARISRPVRKRSPGWNSPGLCLIRWHYACRPYEWREAPLRRHCCLAAIGSCLTTRRGRGPRALYLLAVRSQFRSFSFSSIP